MYKKKGPLFLTDALQQSLRTFSKLTSHNYLYKKSCKEAKVLCQSMNDITSESENRNARCAT